MSSSLSSLSLRSRQFGNRVDQERRKSSVSRGRSIDSDGVSPRPAPNGDGSHRLHPLGAHQWQLWTYRSILDLTRKLPIGGTTVVAVENDLAELKGIGPKHAAMLKEIGVDSIKELRHRNPARLKEMIETRHGKVVGLSEKTVEGWIEEAKTHEV